MAPRIDRWSTRRTRRQRSCVLAFSIPAPCLVGAMCVPPPREPFPRRDPRQMRTAQRPKSLVQLPCPALRGPTNRKRSPARRRQVPRITVGETRLLASPGTLFRLRAVEERGRSHLVLRLTAGPSRKLHPRVLLAGESSTGGSASSRFFARQCVRHSHCT